MLRGPTGDPYPGPGGSSSDTRRSGGQRRGPRTRRQRETCLRPKLPSRFNFPPTGPGWPPPPRSLPASVRGASLQPPQESAPEHSRCGISRAACSSVFSHLFQIATIPRGRTLVFLDFKFHASCHLWPELFLVGKYPISKASLPTQNAGIPNPHMTSNKTIISLASPHWPASCTSWGVTRLLS